jgi:hypothetical protein
VVSHGRCILFSLTTDSTSDTKLGSYIDSQRWEDLAEALYQSPTLPFDRLVRLCLESSSISGPQIQGVDLIAFIDMKTIPDLLQSRSHPGDHPVTTSVSHGDTRLSRLEIGGQLTVVAEVHETRDLSGNQLERLEEAAEYSADAVDNIGDREGPDRSKETLIIQRAVRRYLRKCIEASPDDKLKTGRDRLFEACKVSASAVHARYRKIYLGPVPHLLLCLEWIISRAQASKTKIKARRADATLKGLSDLSSQQTQIT